MQGQGRRYGPRMQDVEDGAWGWGVELHFRSWLRKPGRQTGGTSAEESSLSAQHSLHVVLI